MDEFDFRYAWAIAALQAVNQGREVCWTVPMYQLPWYLSK